MATLSSLFVWSRDAFVSALALSLLHSLWQGVALGAVGLALHARLRRSTPDVRCGAFSLLLLAVFIVWIGTFGALYEAKTYSPVVTAIGSPADAAYNLPVAAALATPSLPALYPLLVALWALGVCALSLRHLGGYLTLRRLCRTLSVPVSTEWQTCAGRIALRLGLRRRFYLRCSAQIDVPFAYGLLRPCILLPITALTGLAPEQIEALIAHELAHIAHYDVFFNSLQICVETILFYHPVVRWLSLQIRLAREQRCDDLAVQIVGDRAVYARALYSLEESRASLPQFALAAKGDRSAMSHSHLVGRIRRVFGVASPEKRDPWSKSALALGAATIGLIAILPAQAYTRHLGHKFAGPPAGGAKSSAPTVSIQTKILLTVGGDSVELDGTELKPNSPVTINGHRSLFGDLPTGQQEQIRKAMFAIDVTVINSQRISEKSTRGKQPSINFDLNVNGKKIKMDRMLVKPDTTITVNGKATQFKNLTPAEQKQVTQALSAAYLVKVKANVKTPNGKSSANPTVIVTSQATSLDSQGKSKGEGGMSLTPDTMVDVNGKECRFGDLPSDQQAIVKQAMSSVNVPATGTSH